MQIAEASIDEAERMILEAISARRDAESVRGEDLSPEICPFVPREQTTNEIEPRKSVDIIHEEHVVIERVLDLLEQARVLIHHGESPPIGFKRWTIAFFFQFANRCHHSREASARSSVLQFRGVSSDGSPVGVMRAHHKQGRAQIHLMQHAVDKHDHAGWSLLAEEYTHLLRQQFQHEIYVLRQTAEVCGTDVDHADLAEVFRNVNRTQDTHEFGEQFDAQIEHWEQQFGISADPISSLAMSVQMGSKDREPKPTSIGSRTEMKMSRTVGEHGLALRDCETDMATFNSLMIERKEPTEDTSGPGREAPRKSK